MAEKRRFSRGTLTYGPGKSADTYQSNKVTSGLLPPDTSRARSGEISRPTDHPLFLPLARPLSSSLLFALPSLENLQSDETSPSDSSNNQPIHEPPRRTQGLLASAAEIRLEAAFAFQVIWIELDRIPLLLGAGLHEKRITEIIVMQMKGDFVIPVTVGPYCLTDRHPRIFDQHLDLGTRLSILITHKPFNGEPMIGFMCGEEN